ncbi:MAG: TSUP family transporter, partial [Nitrospirae bacterium YQR-1]
MGFCRKMYVFLRAASAEHARWDYEVSMSIIKNRKKMLILLVSLLPILLVSVLNAGDMIGSKEAYAPAFYSNLIFFVSIAVGLAAGLITGCIGAGGGFIITPALMAAGVKGILAVGTDVFHIFAKAIMGTTVHKKLGNVSVKLAVAFLAGSGGGTVIGMALGLSREISLKLAVQTMSGTAKM